MASVKNMFVGNSLEIAKPVTHSALDYFEKPEVMINYEGSYDQEVFPQVGRRGPQLDFFVDAEAKNLIDLNRIVLNVEVAIYHDDGKTKAKPGEIEAVFSTTPSTHSFPMPNCT